MVKIYFSYNLITKDIIISNNAFFNRNATISDILEAGKLIKIIDGAEIIDTKLCTIKTPFGVTSIRNLSSGSKTAINVMHIARNKLDYSVDISECGWNALNCIFEFLDLNDSCVQILLRHVDFDECNDFEFIANGSDFCKSTRELKIYAFDKIIGKVQ
jgi:hypothetical protein